MERLEHLSRALMRLSSVLEAQVETTIEQNAALLEDANTAQMNAGKRADGSEITPEYAPLTIAIKQIEGKPLFPTLKDRGDFHSSVVARLTGSKSFEMMATDPKTEALMIRYGEEILGLSEENLEEFRSAYLKPDLQQKARETLGI